MKIIKKTPYTLKGVECLLVQVMEQRFSFADCCNFCVFSNWRPNGDTWGYSCTEIHSCSASSPTFFQVIPIDIIFPQIV